MEKIKEAFKNVSQDNGEGLDEEDRVKHLNRKATMDKAEALRLKKLHNDLSIKMIKKFIKLDLK